ncbi:sensor histidine kinase [Burkholderia sp. L27(2015)]|uniref:sensor histidine kinase n=1 Tax=Burkholderia sp. L27(2015) TaxID=1641858 RepID=UPI0020B12F63|nr:ATP-binding protein [Burkholderia sp. L27(2015)]
MLAPAAKQDVHESVALSAKVWFETLLSGQSPSAQDMDVFREISQRREHQRVPLQNLLQALRLGLREIWSTYVALGELDERIAKELLADVSVYLLDHFDLVAQIMVRAYLAEQTRQPGWAELVTAIEEGARRSESVRHRLVALLDQLSDEPDLLSRLEVDHAREHRGTEAAGAQVMKFFGLDVDIDDGAELSKALRDAQERLAQASRLAAVAELSASIAHELNQPLQAIVAHGRACVRWLAATPPKIDEAKYSAEQLLRDANGAADVVSRIRALFRHTAPQKVDLDINKLILQVCTLMADDIQRNAVSLETILGEDVSKISADVVQIQQVIVNLVRNAIEALAATQERPRLLVIRSHRDADNVVIDVEDRGTGHMDFEKIFEPFFTTKETGMGMGLAICRSIIEAHAGRIWAVRNVSRGVTFKFSLPIEKSNATAR